MGELKKNDHISMKPSKLFLKRIRNNKNHVAVAQTRLNEGNGCVMWYPGIHSCRERSI